MTTPEEQFRQLGWCGKIVISAIGATVAVVGAFGMIALFGMMLEGIASDMERRDICQKRAATPYEYHQCQ